jgi:hypothetical protein
MPKVNSNLSSFLSIVTDELAIHFCRWWIGSLLQVDALTVDSSYSRISHCNFHGKYGWLPANRCPELLHVGTRGQMAFTGVGWVFGWIYDLFNLWTGTP